MDAGCSAGTVPAIFFYLTCVLHRRMTIRSAKAPTLSLKGALSTGLPAMGVIHADLNLRYTAVTSECDAPDRNQQLAVDLD